MSKEDLRVEGKEMPMPVSFGNSPPHFAGDIETLPEKSKSTSLKQPNQ
jgi:hypothetical protein